MRKGANPETVDKLVTALEELYVILSYTDKVNLSKFFGEKQIGSAIRSELVKGGIIENIGGKAKSARYKWTSIEPNRAMAVETLDRVAVVSAKYTKLAKERKVGAKLLKQEVAMQNKAIATQPDTPQLSTIPDFPEIMLVDSITTKYLWGLIKITTKFNYKKQTK